MLMVKLRIGQSEWPHLTLNLVMHPKEVYIENSQLTKVDSLLNYIRIIADTR